MKATAKEIQAAIRVLMAATDDGLILAADCEKSVYLVPAFTDKGRLEFQVSDGLPGDRSSSSDFGSFAEAMRYFRKLKEGRPTVIRRGIVRGPPATVTGSHCLNGLQCLKDFGSCICLCDGCGRKGPEKTGTR